MKSMRARVVLLALAVTLLAGVASAQNAVATITQTIDSSASARVHALDATEEVISDLVVEVRTTT